MEIFEKLVNKTKSKYPDYKFSWEILTGIILNNIAKKPYWLDIGARNNILIDEQLGAEFSVGLDIERQKGLKVNHNVGAYVIADSSRLPFKENSFGFITSRYTFEHLEFPQKTLDEISRVLKQNGTFAMQTTNAGSPLILMARLIPIGLKKIIFKKIFIDYPSGIFKTHYKINRPKILRKITGPLMLEKLIMVEDLLCQSRVLYAISLLIFKFIRLLKLDSYKNNIIAIYKKN